MKIKIAFNENPITNKFTFKYVKTAAGLLESSLQILPTNSRLLIYNTIDYRFVGERNPSPVNNLLRIY